MKRNPPDSSSPSSVPHIPKKTKPVSPPPEFILDLPVEIIFEILSRLPVKSLFKFRCFSKSWLSLISSPSFIHSHLKIAKQDSNFTKFSVLLNISTPVFDLQHCPVRSLAYEPFNDALAIDYPQRHPNKEVWIVGSCNGLVCIAINEKDLFVWNPTTVKSTQLPPVQVNMKPGFYNIFGFGYTESSNDYKVLCIFCEDGHEGACESVVNLYSLKTNSWKRIGDFTGGIPFYDSCKFASGKLHFSTTHGVGLSSRLDIVSLDLETEAYGLLDQPNYADGTFECTLEVLCGCICIMCNYVRNHSDLWLLKEYGVQSSWTKIVTIPYFTNLGRVVYSKPLFILANDEILLFFGMHLVIYNPKENRLRKCETSIPEGFPEADVYVESLVSPAQNIDHTIKTHARI